MQRQQKQTYLNVPAQVFFKIGGRRRRCVLDRKILEPQGLGFVIAVTEDEVGCVYDYTDAGVVHEDEKLAVVRPISYR